LAKAEYRKDLAKVFTSGLSMSNLVTNIQGYSLHDGPGIRTVVFLKGCGLECRWCSNPECISPKPEIGFFKVLCTQCGNCAEVCHQGALVLEAGMPHIDRQRCTGCGDCSTACTYKALVLYGKAMDANEIFNAVKQDKMFYETSGGGVTISGGEALLQPELVADVFKQCHAAGINTCIETSGNAPASAFKEIIPHTDYVLYDLKIMNPQKHREYTGYPNDRILANALITAKSNPVTLFRMPLIPGINDNAQNIKEIAEFLNGLGENFRRIELMPYHRLGKGKYDSLNKEYTMPGILAPDPERLEAIKTAFGNHGIKCSISN
jgi:pyruvate formate lyase activating enzyme